MIRPEHYKEVIEERDALAARLATFEKIMEAVYADRDRLREALKGILDTKEYDGGRWVGRLFDAGEKALRQSEGGQAMTLAEFDGLFDRRPLGDDSKNSPKWQSIRAALEHRERLVEAVREFMDTEDRSDEELKAMSKMFRIAELENRGVEIKPPSPEPPSGR